MRVYLTLVLNVIFRFQRPTDFTFPYHEELPTVVVVNKSKRTPVGGGGAASHRTLPLVDELETGKKPGPSSDKE